MPEKAAATIRCVLNSDPDAEIRYTEAIAPETPYLHSETDAKTLFVHPMHEELIQSLRQA